MTRINEECLGCIVLSLAREGECKIDNCLLDEDPNLDAKVDDEKERKRRIATKKAEDEMEHGDEDV